MRRFPHKSRRFLTFPHFIAVFLSIHWMLLCFVLLYQMWGWRVGVDPGLHHTEIRTFSVGGRILILPNYHWNRCCDVLSAQRVTCCNDTHGKSLYSFSNCRHQTCHLGVSCGSVGRAAIYEPEGQCFLACLNWQHTEVSLNTTLTPRRSTIIYMQLSEQQFCQVV